jgi:HNH endonuclease
METIWRSVHQHPFSTCYEVSDDGRVRRLAGVLPDGRRHRGGELAKVLVKRYHLVLLQCLGEKWMVRVHHLVAYAFIGSPPEAPSVTGYQINHLNGDPLDNRAVNLEWTTAHQNQKHSFANRLHPRGERQHLAVLDEARVRKAREMYAAGHRIIDIAAAIDSNHATTSAVVHGKTWRHVV